jgi:hypothetical protein
MIFYGGILAYKTSMGIRIFVLSAGMSLIIAILPVGYHSVKAALASPASSIRYESPELFSKINSVRIWISREPFL